jgi:hypothetical protein
MELRTGHKFQTNSQRSMLLLNARESNVDNGGTIICPPLFPKIPGLSPRRTSFSDFIDNRATSGRISQRNSQAGK